MYNLEDSISAALEAGETILVPSRQRAVAIRLSYAAAQLQRGHSAWKTPAVHATDGWLQTAGLRLRAAGVDLPRALGVHEEWLLWAEAAAELTAAAPLLLPESIADGLARAAGLAADQRIPAAAIAADPATEARWLAAAISHVEQRATRLGAMPRHRRWATLGGADPRPLGAARLRLLGHGPLAPALRWLIESWQGRGPAFTLHAATAPPIAASVRVEQAADPVLELRCAAEWCARLLAADPQARLLLVLPDLARQRLQLDRVLRETLEPSSCLDPATPPRAFGYEGGAPLADYALPRAALETLALLVRRVPVAAATAVLEATFWPVASRAGRARAARGLRGRAVGSVELDEVLQALQAIGAEDPACAAIAQRLGVARGLLTAPRLGAADWAEAFSAALLALGWPGSATADTAGQQALLGWHSLVEEFAAISAVLGPCPAERALEVLSGMARREAFAPLGADVPVRVTASLDDPVVRYDGIRVCGLQADVWPPPVQLDPYVPWLLQRQAGIEASSPAGCLRRARTAMAAWQGAVPDGALWLSSARRDEDTELAPSPLLGAWPQELVQPALPTLVEQLRSTAPAQLEPLDDVRGLPWPAGRPLPRGVRTLELQNRCPFRAYAEIRLGAEQPRAPQPGISALDRGEYLHRVLELIWAQLGDSAVLAGLSSTRLDAQVAAAATAALGLLRRGDRPGPDARTLTREHARAVEVVRGVLERERGRAPFRVLAREWELDTTIAGMPIRLRIDRVDACDDDRLVILDYKTGAARGLDWLGERAEPVQLFAYAVALQQRQAGDVAALGNLHLVRRGKVYDTSAAADNPLFGAKPGASDWGQLLRQWQGQVERLIGEFVQGDARVMPLPDACKGCHLQGACRRAELGIGGDGRV